METSKRFSIEGQPIDVDEWIKANRHVVCLSHLAAIEAAKVGGEVEILTGALSSVTLRREV